MLKSWPASVCSGGPILNKPLETFRSPLTGERHGDGCFPVHPLLFCCAHALVISVGHAPNMWQPPNPFHSERFPGPRDLSEPPNAIHSHFDHQPRPDETKLEKTTVECKKGHSPGKMNLVWPTIWAAVAPTVRARTRGGVARLAAGVVDAPAGSLRVAVQLHGFGLGGELLDLLLDLR